MPVQIGDTVTIQRNQEQFVAVVTGLAEKRGSAAIAQTLYQETGQSIAARKEQHQLRKLHAASAPEGCMMMDNKTVRRTP